MKENAAKLSKRIEELGTFDVCYESDSNRPVLVHLSVIQNDPTTFKRYLSECSIVDLEDKVGAKAEPQNWIELKMSNRLILD